MADLRDLEEQCSYSGPRSGMALMAWSCGRRVPATGNLLSERCQIVIFS